MEIPFEKSREEADELFEQLIPGAPTGCGLTQAGFDEALGKALRLCRSAADLGLPIEEMLDHVADALEIRQELVREGEADAELLAGGAAELEALREIIAAVGEVAAIGAGLAGQEGAMPPQNRPATAPPERSFPLPANLREA